jgi:hypothetical protein
MKNESDIFVVDFSDLLKKLKNDIAILKKGEKHSFCYFSSDESPFFDLLHIQSMKRFIDGRSKDETTFIGLKNIALKANCRGQGAFTKFLDELESYGYPILIYNIVNIELDIHLESKGYALLIEESEKFCLYDDDIYSRYKK